MEVIQFEYQLEPYSRGFHLIQEEINRALAENCSLKTGIVHLFIQHTSAGLTINENADPTVRGDFERHMNEMVPENAPYYKHTLEGPDDMPAHIKASLMGSSVSIPLTNGSLNTGTWQGVYLCEHRNHASSRTLVITVSGV